MSCNKWEDYRGADRVVMQWSPDGDAPYYIADDMGHALYHEEAECLVHMFNPHGIHSFKCCGCQTLDAWRCANASLFLYMDDVNSDSRAYTKWLVEKSWFRGRLPLQQEFTMQKYGVRIPLTNVGANEPLILATWARQRDYLLRMNAIEMLKDRHSCTMEQAIVLYCTYYDDDGGRLIWASNDDMGLFGSHVSYDTIRYFLQGKVPPYLFDKRPFHLFSGVGTGKSPAMAKKNDDKLSFYHLVAKYKYEEALLDKLREMQEENCE